VLNQLFKFCFVASDDFALSFSACDLFLNLANIRL
jgi:hypothetical protein